MGWGVEDVAPYKASEDTISKNNQNFTHSKTIRRQNNSCRGRRPRRPAINDYNVNKGGRGDPSPTENIIIDCRGGAIFAKQICHEAKRRLFRLPKRAIIANKNG